MRLRTFPALLALLLALLAPAMAGAQSTIAPPGNSGVDEYVEVVPSADGPRHGGDGTGSTGVSAKTQQQLNRQGADGQAVSRLAGGTSSPASNGSATSTSKAGRGGRAKTDRVPTGDPDVAGAASNGAESVPAAVARAVTDDSGGMGLLLPLLLGAVLLAGGLTVLMRRRAL